MTARPRIARVEIQWSENRAVPVRVFPSLASADAALARAFATSPPPDAGYDKTQFQIVWTDGETYAGRANVSRALVDGPGATEGILRAHLRASEAAWRAVADGTVRSSAVDGRQRAARALELLARLASERRRARNAATVPDDEVLAVGSETDVDAPSLMPHPLAAVAALEARCSPMTNRRARYAANWLTLALTADLSSLPSSTASGWLLDWWHHALARVSLLLGRDPDSMYPGAATFWTDHARPLARAVAASSSGARNAGTSAAMPYRVTSRRADGSLEVTYHTARDYLAAVRAAHFYLGSSPEIVKVEGQYHGDDWSAV